jgi:hypothetical protein
MQNLQNDSTPPKPDIPTWSADSNEVSKHAIAVCVGLAAQELLSA